MSAAHIVLIGGATIAAGIAMVYSGAFLALTVLIDWRRINRRIEINK